MRTRVFGVLLLAFLAIAGAAHAQSFLGTIRGTVIDPQGGGVSDAAVLVVDEATGVPRAVGTDSQGRFEASNLKPGTYRIEVATPNFKEFKQTGVVLRAAGSINLDVKLELGSRTETVTVTAEAINNITTDSGAIARGLDEQQLHDLPRNSRDIQSFLLLNPNVLGGSDDIQFLGGRTYGVSYIQDGQASTNAIFGTVGNSAPGLDAIAEVQVLSNSYSAEYGGLAGVVVTTKRGSNSYRGTALLRLQLERPERPHLQPEAGPERRQLADLRDDPNSDTHRAPVRGQPRRPAQDGQDLLLRELRGLQRQGDLRRRTRHGPHRGHARRRLPRHRDHPARSADRPALPEPGDPGQPHHPAGDGDHELLLSAAQSQQPGQRTTASSSSSCPSPRTAIAPTSASTTRRARTTRSSCAAATSTTTPTPITLRIGRQRRSLTNLPILNRKLNTATASRAGRRSSPARPSTSSASASTTTRHSRQSTFINADVSRQLGLELPAEHARRPPRASPASSSRPGTNRPTNIADAGRGVDRTVDPELLLRGRQLLLDQGRPLA